MAGRRRREARAAYGETDDFSYNVVRDPVHVHDLHATILHCLGIDHTKLTYQFQGRDFRLTDVHGERGEAAPGLTPVASIFRFSGGCQEVVGSPSPPRSGGTA